MRVASLMLAGLTAQAGIIGTISAAEQPARESGDHVLEEVVVTATRRSTSIQAAPLSVTALTGSQLQAIGAQDLPDYFTFVPGLYYNDNGWSPRIIIRGVGTTGTLVEARPLSALYLDDTPMMTVAGPPQLGQIGGPHPEAFDLARIEVLRGPQGTLFGTSSLGGAIRMITNAPNPNGWYANTAADFSSSSHGGDTYQVSGIVNIPLVTDRAALRAGGYYRDEAGFIDNVERGIPDVDSARTSGGRVALLWRPAPPLTLTLRGQHQARNAEGLSYTDLHLGKYDQTSYVAESTEESWELLNLTIEYDLQWAQVMSSTSYLDRQPALTYDETANAEMWTGLFNPAANEFRDSVRDLVQELRLTSDVAGRLSWLVGAYYQVEDRANNQNLRSPGYDALTGGEAASYGYPDILTHIEGRSTQRQRALYGELLFEIASRWQATVGGRWFDIREDREAFRDGLLIGGPNSPTIGVLDEEGFTAKLGVAYLATEDSLLFFNAAEGFRPGGANAWTEPQVENCSSDLAALGLTEPPATFSSDSLWSYELGAKTSWLDNKLTANGTVYHIDWDDTQTAKDLTCGMTFFENAGGTKVDGLELEAVLEPTEWLELSAGAAYVNTRLVQDVPSISGEKGESIPTLPAWTLSVTADAEFNLPLAVGFARAAYQYVDGSWSDFDEAVRVRMPSRQLVSLGIGIRRDAWQIELYVDNLLDERGVMFHSIGPDGGQEWLSRPRTVGLRAQVDFARAQLDR